MLLNDDISLRKQQELLNTFSESLENGKCREMAASLFWAARNGAISTALRRLEAHFREKSMNVFAEWKESSMNDARIELTMKDNRSGLHTRTIWIERKSKNSVDSSISELTYTLKHVETGAYYRGKVPFAATQFDAVLSHIHFSDKAKKIIQGVNYPFTYESLSSF